MPLKYESEFRALAIETHLETESQSKSESESDSDPSRSSNRIPIHISQTSFNWRLIRNQRDF